MTEGSHLKYENRSFAVLRMTRNGEGRMKSERFINAQRALYADMRAAMNEGRAEVIYDSETALLLHETVCGVYFLAAQTTQDAEKLLDSLRQKDPVVVLHGSALYAIAAQLGYEIDPPCRQAMYAGGLLPADGDLTVRHPDEADFPTVDANYHLVNGAELHKDFVKPDFLGGYSDGKLVGFAGLHSEGSMGLLTVLPEYRRRGFAQQIYSALINNQLRKGRIPYAQIYTDNENSLNLQKKLGFVLSEDTIAWSWLPDAEAQ